MADYPLSKNAEGYKDPTAMHAIKTVIAEEQDEQKQLSTLVFIIKYIIRLAGFEPVGRIKLRNVKSGRIYE